MAQQDVLDYIRNTPHNSNVNVVKGMLNNSGDESNPEIYYVDFAWNEDYTTLTTDADFSEAVSAKNAGKLIIARISGEEDGYSDTAFCYLDMYSSYYDEETEETQESFRFRDLSNTNVLETKADFSQMHFVWSNYAPIANYSTHVMLAIESS